MFIVMGLLPICMGTGSSHELQCICGLFEGRVCNEVGVVLLIRLEILGTRTSSTLSEILSNNFNHFVFVFILYLSFCLSNLSIAALRFETRPSALLDWEKGQSVRFNFFGQQKRDSGKQPLHKYSDLYLLIQITKTDLYDKTSPYAILILVTE